MQPMTIKTEICKLDRTELQDIIIVCKLVFVTTMSSFDFSRGLFVCLMVFNATFNDISVISWRSVLLVEETGVPGEKTALSQVTDKLYHIMLYTSP